ncbi:GHKL domain-containing protein [Rossellomorea aquimaris]|nr:GHKL domain-containing protein [Rossellomorea aquimaris]WRP08790.1 GHKL domain-containing protein [Rossellomorea aquimaris]
MNFYWVTLILLGFVHLHALLLNLAWDFPFYITFLVVSLTLYILFRKKSISFLKTDQRWMGALFLIQLLLLLPYLVMEVSWFYGVFLVLFMCLEWIRWEVSNRIAQLHKENGQFEEERAQLTETFRIVRSERHDFLKHVSSIHYMLENRHHDEATAYLDDLVDGYEETNLSIKGERGSIAGILHQMYSQGKASGVTMIYDVDLPLSTLPIPDKKLVTLLGNLLSNSIDASIEWQNHYGKPATVTLQFYKRSGLYVLICQNPSLPIPIHILDKLYQSYGHTTKGEKHEGLGTKVIQDTVGDYQGLLDFVFRDEEFTVKIKFPAIH